MSTSNNVLLDSLIDIECRLSASHTTNWIRKSQLRANLYKSVVLKRMDFYEALRLLQKLNVRDKVGTWSVYPVRENQSTEWVCQCDVEGVDSHRAATVLFAVKSALHSVPVKTPFAACLGADS